MGLLLAPKVRQLFFLPFPFPFFLFFPFFIFLNSWFLSCPLGLIAAGLCLVSVRGGGGSRKKLCAKILFKNITYCLLTLLIVGVK